MCVTQHVLHDYVAVTCSVDYQERYIFQNPFLNIQQSRCYKKKNPLTKHWIIKIHWMHWERTRVVINKYGLKISNKHGHSIVSQMLLIFHKHIRWQSAQPWWECIGHIMHINRAVSLICVSTQDHQCSFTWHNRVHQIRNVLSRHHQPFSTAVYTASC